jgi:hypothetical protein
VVTAFASKASLKADLHRGNNSGHAKNSLACPLQFQLVTLASAQEIRWMMSAASNLVIDRFACVRIEEQAVLVSVSIPVEVKQLTD